MTFTVVGVCTGRLRCLVGVFGRLDHPASSTDKTWNIELFGKLFVEQTNKQKLLKSKSNSPSFFPELNYKEGVCFQEFFTLSYKKYIFSFRYF